MSGERGPQELAFERRTRELLEQSAEHLPAALRSRLTRARHAALEQPGTRLPRVALRWAPAGAVVAAVAALLIVLLPHGVAPSLPSSGALEDIEMLSDRDAMPLSSEPEDYDFYEWAVDEAGAKGSVGT